MRIAIDARPLTDARLTGVGFYTLNLIHELAKQAPEADIMLFVSGTDEVLNRVPDFPYPNVEVVAITLPNRILFGLLKLPLPITLESFLPRMPDFWFFPNHNIVKTKLPYALTVHDVSFSLYPDFFTHKDHLLHRLGDSRKLAERADLILAVSESTAHDLHHHWNIPEEKIRVTHLGVDQTRFVAREQPSDRTFRAAYDLNCAYFLSVATQEPRKNLESVIEGYDAYRVRGGKPYPLVLAGGAGWKMNRLEKIRKSSLFKEDIRVLGYVPEKHKPAIYRGAKVFLFPSFYEGFGLPVLEAMACGIPVITSFTSSLPEITKDAGVLIDPFNVNDITEALLSLFESAKGEEMRKQLSKKGLAYAKTFSWKNTGAKTLKAFSAFTAR
jgi:glycosyltransferase involved in cell wall biosynthesis